MVEIGEQALIESVGKTIKEVEHITKVNGYEDIILLFDDGTSFKIRRRMIQGLHLELKDVDEKWFA